MIHQHIFSSTEKSQIFKSLDEAPIVVSKKCETKELLNAVIVIEPYDYIWNIIGRNLNISYIKREIQWYLRGKAKDTTIAHHAKIWQDLIQSDGTINSNYGRYIFDGSFERVANGLIRDPHSRQGVITINGRLSRHLTDDRDMPCTMYINFFIRQDTLYMKVAMRSNDAIFGLFNDIAFFGTLHQMMFQYLKNDLPTLKYGQYYHCADSLHVYPRHYEMIKRLIGAKEDPLDIPKISSRDEVKAMVQRLDRPIPGTFYHWLHLKS